MTIPLSEPDISAEDIEAVTRVLRSTRLSLGPELRRFEAAFEQLTGLPHAVGVSSGTAGLHLCIRALGIGPGDEVIVPSFAFVAVANAVRYEGATPVFVDIETASLNVDPERVAAAITSNTRAIIAVHTFGVPAQLDELIALCKRHGILLIEDACEAIGATYAGQPVGSFGHAAVFAFYPNKQITTGEGGMIVTRDEELASACRALRNQGRKSPGKWHQHDMLGFNYRLSDLNAALGSSQLNRLDSILRKREAVAQMYDSALRAIRGVQLPPRASLPHTMSWFVYVVRLAQHRDYVADQLISAGIECGRYFAPIHEQGAYADWPQAHALPITEAESRKTLALPFSTNLTQTAVDHVVRHFERAIAQSHELAEDDSHQL